MSTRRWIHCGLCSALITASKETKFYHLSCLDILCRPCMGKTNRGTTCPVCNNPISHFSELCNSMSRREKMLYHAFPAGLFQMSCQALLFQQKHRQRLVHTILKARDTMKRLDALETQIQQQIVQTQRRKTPGSEPNGESISLNAHRLVEGN
uniref:RING-type domain-containing protein n=1 Tax=Anopheles epiroticus TaxID=199890 RepID=A0A182P4X6_9DIPT